MSAMRAKPKAKPRPTARKAAPKKRPAAASPRKKAAAQAAQKSEQEYRDRMAWFNEARFGMFIHWGLYSLLGRGEWVMLQERIPAQEYAKLADRFKPKRFDADAWAGLAAEAGMKYMVLTTRHHDGFCLYDSEVSDFTAPKTAAKRDFVAEYAEACRRAGLRVGFYYSLLDWRFPGYWDPRGRAESRDAMVAQAHAQVRELLTQYGKVDVLWYDGGWVPAIHENPADAWTTVPEFWKSKKLNAMVRELQPGIIINNRSGIDEDIDTPEQHVTASKAGRAWESCMTIGDSCGWGYVENNPNGKRLPQLLQHLVTAAKDGGNYLLNVGPQPDGAVRKKEAKVLKAMGGWMKKNGEGIYGSERTGFAPPSMIGEWTVKGNTGYFHIFRWPGKEAVAACVATRVKRATLLATGLDVAFRQEHNGRLVFTGLPTKPPHKAVSVIKVEFEGPPAVMPEKDRAAWLDGDA
jgi:alpha-L-fucosidase